jgi:hypothetical protein
MSKNERYSRLILKRTLTPSLSATTAPTNDHTIFPAWSTTDIYPGEFFLNLMDERLYIRTNYGIKEVPIAQFSNPIAGDMISYDGYKWINVGAIGTGATSGSSGINGTSGTDGISGIDGTSGSSGSSGINGSSGLTMSGLTDVNIILPLLDGEVLKYYSGATSGWTNKSIVDGMEMTWSKSTQTLTFGETDDYPYIAVKVEGRPIDHLTGDTILTDNFYTLLCDSGLTLTLPATSGTPGDSYHGSIFKFKLIQSGTSTVQCDVTDSIFDDAGGLPLTSIILSEFGKTITLQADAYESMWYLI